MANDIPFIVFEIKEYMVIFRQLEERDFGGVVAKIRGMVRCTGSGINDDNQYRLDVFFLTADSAVPEPQIKLDEGSGEIFFPMSDMSTVIDILRNEKPIFGHLRVDNLQWTSITTSNEPVGEGNVDADF
jgi:hypothetical protein